MAHGEVEEGEAVLGALGADGWVLLVLRELLLILSGESWEERSGGR